MYKRLVFISLTMIGAITDGGSTPVIREKPFLFVNKNNKYFVMVPALRQASDGVDWEGGTPSGTSIPIDQFYIVKPKTNGKVIVINAAPI